MGHLARSARGRIIRSRPFIFSAQMPIPRGALRVCELEENAVHDVARLMEKYANLPMDLADATLMVLAARTGASLVQRIGHTAILFRPNPDRRRIVLPRG